ncbi:tRNA threonylcarbamoyl adenosine modification protein YeaZ [Parelusimicrobium proximum]|uniref:tRNA (adenosine(37)-N6)-threonylcarbamoyltransferase complex dimerization subunit type 1 TsaB n=1 Tax=Parelusimicrobium proximum TaxID=3228953 RepID=UPI003D1690A5
MEHEKQIILAVDSTGSPLTVAISVSERCGEKAVKPERIFYASKKGVKQEELLFPLIKRVLAKAECEFKDISKVFFIRGPGRFTGIRIGLTLATMLRSLNNTEAASATVFEILHDEAARSREFKAWQKTHPRGVHAVVLHAFREEYFLQFFDGSAPMWMNKEDLFSALKAYGKELFITGFDSEKTSLSALLSGCTLGSDKLCKITPAALIRAAEKYKFEKGTLEPLYLKPARFERGA